MDWYLIAIYYGISLVAIINYFPYEFGLVVYRLVTISNDFSLLYLILKVIPHTPLANLYNIQNLSTYP